MAECLEVLCEASLEEQQDEVTVLQSIFEDDLQILQGGDGHANICFNLTVKVNIPHDAIDFEAFIPGRAPSYSESRLNSDFGNHPIKDDRDKESETSSGNLGSRNLFNESHFSAQEIGLEASSLGEKENNTIPSFSGRRAKPGFTRSVSLHHWRVRADIRYLTPILLTCTFPPLYPTECPPEFSLACLWLTRSKLQELQEKLMNLWTETPSLPIVFTWADWLQNYAYEYLCLGSHLVLKESESKTMPQPQSNAATNGQSLVESERFNTKLETALLTIFEYDLEMQRQAFWQNTHLCEICFDERDGTEFHYLDECKHFFCADCLKVHCQLHVDGGTVLKLLCPSHDCKTKIPPEILQKVLDAEKLERWERLLFSKTLDVMGGVVYCPRCNVAVLADEDETSRLGHCANCFYAFCTECYEPWHHGQPCRMESDLGSDDEDSSESEEKVHVVAKTLLCENCSVEKDNAEFHFLYECSHFFCSACLKVHFQWHVDDNTILTIRCLNRNCKAGFSVEILQEVLDAETFKRYERLFRAKTLEDLGISDVDFCPRCTMAVAVDEDESLRHYGLCANCSFEFCTECFEPWHHGRPCSVEADSVGDDEENRKSKKKATEDEAGGSAVAVSSGKQDRLYREQKLSNLSFIRVMRQLGNYQCCPKCRMAVERIAGCDMMHCSQCTASFCWTCGKEISGYDHFAYCGRGGVRLPPAPPPIQAPVQENLPVNKQTTNPKGKPLRTKLCPRCHQRCFKENNNNHLKCWNCKTGFCYQCGKEIKGAVTMHFTAANSCTQHSDD